MAKSIWQDKFIIEAYNLAKDGMTEAQISKVMGISVPTFRLWEKKKKLFKQALEQGRKEGRGKDGKPYQFADYVYQRLPPDLRKIWKEIHAIEKAKGGVMKLEALLAHHGKRVRQYLFLHALAVSNFNISAAMRKLNLNRGTFDKWKDEPEFAQLVDDMDWFKGNFFESHLLKLIAGGDRAAIIFANETYNKTRGYNKKVEVNMNVEGNINQNIVSVEGLKLPLKMRKELLERIRQQRQKS